MAKPETFPARGGTRLPSVPPVKSPAWGHRWVCACKGKSGEKINPGTGQDVIQPHRSLGHPIPGAGYRAGTWSQDMKEVPAEIPNMGILPPVSAVGPLPHPNVAFVF